MDHFDAKDWLNADAVFKNSHAVRRHPGTRRRSGRRHTGRGERHDLCRRRGLLTGPGAGPFGGMAAIPKRAVEVENVMTGRTWAEATIKAGQATLSRSFQPISDMRASADYRLTVAQNLLHKFFIETTAPSTMTRIHRRAAS